MTAMSINMPKKNPDNLPGILSFSKGVLFLLDVFVAVHKFINPTCSIYKLHFTSIERVACIRNLEFDERVLFTVLPFYNLTGICS